MPCCLVPCTRVYSSSLGMQSVRPCTFCAHMLPCCLVPCTQIMLSLTERVYFACMLGICAHDICLLCTCVHVLLQIMLSLTEPAPRQKLPAFLLRPGAPGTHLLPPGSAMRLRRARDNANVQLTLVRGGLMPCSSLGLHVVRE